MRLAIEDTRFTFYQTSIFWVVLPHTLIYFSVDFGKAWYFLLIASNKLDQAVPDAESLTLLFA